MMMMMIRNRFTAVVLKNENQQIAPDTTNRHIMTRPIYH